MKTKIILSIIGLIISNTIHTNAINLIRNSRADISINGQATALSKKIEYDYPNKISNDYFEIKYDTKYNSTEEAQQMLSLFEQARLAVKTLGFKDNYANEHSKKLPIELNPYNCFDSNGNILNKIASTRDLNYYGNKIDCEIVFYKMKDLTQQIKETIFHEYFHTIQNNYNGFYVSDETAWFVEASADWAKYKFNKDTFFSNYRFLNYMSSDFETPINKTSGYYELSYIFTLEKMFDENVVKKIYEELENRDLYFGFSSLKESITNVLKNNYNSSETFNTVFKSMSSSIISMKNNFPNYDIPFDETSFEQINKTVTLSPTSTTTILTQPYANSYYKIELPSNIDYHDININTSTNYQNLYIQLYVINDVNHYIYNLNNSNGVFNYNLSGLSSTINKAYIVITNCESSTISFDLKLSYTNHIFKNHYCSLCGNYLEDHVYKYSYLNKTTHTGLCDCGDSLTSSHVVNANDTSFKKTCILCGAKGIFGVSKY